MEEKRSQGDGKGALFFLSRTSKMPPLLPHLCLNLPRGDANMHAVAWSVISELGERKHDWLHISQRQKKKTSPGLNYCM